MAQYLIKGFSTRIRLDRNQYCEGLNEYAT